MKKLGEVVTMIVGIILLFPAVVLLYIAAVLLWVGANLINLITFWNHGGYVSIPSILHDFDLDILYWKQTNDKVK